MSSSRFPVEARAVGLLKHGRQKICILSVLWSDQNNILIYRTFEEFKKLHKELKRKFPIESGLLKKSERTIPRFHDVNVMLRKKQALSQGMHSLKLLEDYCQELLKTQPKIIQGEDVVQFFGAQSRDLDPAFPENSILVLPSEMGARKAEAPPRPASLGITQPVIAQVYRCLEAFDTDDTKGRPFKALKGETLEVLMKDKTGWWLVENCKKQIAWFPAPYLEQAEEDATTREHSGEGMLSFLTQAYEAREPDELSVKAGVVVEVLEKSDNGWWLVWYNGNAGYVPSMFLQPYQNPHSKFLALANGSTRLSTTDLSGARGDLSQSPPAQRKGCQGQNTWARAREETDLVQGAAAAMASPGLASDTERLSDSSANVSDQEPDWPQNPEDRGAGTILHTEAPAHTLRTGTDSPSLPSKTQQRSSPGLSEEPWGGLDRPHRSSGRPAVPPRPSRCEILQRCTTMTRRAMQRASPSARSLACQ
ncbi:NADPH oxidase organizer 1 [Varanus komodoensis]|uniref:NADPH oxidase organizer 1 n=1 Tax=Varanus komodoensis TaxID=61221 RepID=UPI001CF79386|nr:NADPH oxidase organizer 1 [Varanus komodoensis]